MSYEQALEAAGAKVLASERFGSYQGDWFALVEYEGRRGYVHGAYGSCSGCDDFEAEFDVDNEKCQKHRYDRDSPTCAACDAAKVEYQRRLVEFGRDYLDQLLTQAEAEALASKNLAWDADAHEMLKWLKSQNAEHSKEPDILG